ncbi:hypothetical protein N658DRAFT_70375 [Parathielavia hyrcaniae]|uniref:Secreted protein n=1 Tax=Parathielavia hyrcaniae TaxID=113614 RepID=A0AAN6Q0D1_9PEZI|nr:hypothetical protein N658DRAFT_70375 [Parathielavia hyrcaniae]
MGCVVFLLLLCFVRLLTFCQNSKFEQRSCPTRHFFVLEFKTPVPLPLADKQQEHALIIFPKSIDSVLPFISPSRTRAGCFGPRMESRGKVTRALQFDIVWYCTSMGCSGSDTSQRRCHPCPELAFQQGGST